MSNIRLCGMRENSASFIYGSVNVRVDRNSLETFTAGNSSGCDASTQNTTISLASISDQDACIDGVSETQVIVAEAQSSLGGYFYAYFQGAQSGSINVDATGEDVASKLNEMSTLSNVQVTRHVHSDTPNSGYAWVVTFPASTEFRVRNPLRNGHLSPCLKMACTETGDAMILFRAAAAISPRGCKGSPRGES